MIAPTTPSPPPSPASAPNRSPRFRRRLRSPPSASAAIARTGTEPHATVSTAIDNPPAHSGRRRRIYNEARQDRALGSSHQRRLHRHLPCKEVYPLDPGHSPFYAAPEELASSLLQV